MAVESLRGAYGQTLLKLGRENPDLVVLDADLAKSTQTRSSPGSSPAASSTWGWPSRT